MTWRLLARMLGSPLAYACELPHEREQWPIGAEHLRRESRSTSELGPLRFPHPIPKLIGLAWLPSEHLSRCRRMDRTVLCLRFAGLSSL